MDKMDKDNPSESDQCDDMEKNNNVACDESEVMVFGGGENMESEHYLGLDRPAKRGREINGEEQWIRVGRKAKRFNRRGVNNDATTGTAEEITFMTEVCITCTEKLPKQFGLAKLLKAEGIQGITRIKYVNEYKVLIHCSSDNSAESLIQSKRFNEGGFKCHRTLEKNQSYGVIFDVDLEMTEEEILQDLVSDTAILAVKRLKRRNTADGKWVTSEAVRITFKGASLPTYVYIYDTRTKVSPYNYPVTQCARCWRYGHTVKMCPSSKIVCPKCSEDHPNCTTTIFQCNNCSGRHMAMAKVCPVYVKERKIRDLMTKFNCSYKRALAMYTIHIPSPMFTPEILPQEPSQPVESQALFEQSQDTLEPPTEKHELEKSSYAGSVKTNKVNPNRIVNANKKKSVKNRKEQAEILFDDNMSVKSVSEGGPKSQEERSEHKEKITWQLLLAKLKRKLFEEEGVAWTDKIKSCVSTFLEGIISIVLQYMTDLPGLSFIKELWVTTHTSP
ncbi:uncharacterized protein LOC134675005 [Cydia fagiglandana]|uniref:uncharacterized protein LOC134675005 n=1 Tax=Cydia fagiglandana TaxID=1458189 RepID=UPI002FEE0913